MDVQWGLWAYGVLGASYLWPWNCLITAAVLAQLKLEESHPTLYSNYSSVVMSISTLITLLVNLHLASRPCHFAWRVRHGLLFIVVAFVAASLGSEFLDGKYWFGLIVAVVALASLGSTLTQNGVMAICQRIPSDGAHVLANLNGQAVAGIFPPIIAMSMASKQLQARVAPFVLFSVVVLAAVALHLFDRPENRKYIAITDSEVQSSSELPPYRELRGLLHKMWAPSVAVFLGFVASLSYPVFANRIPSSQFTLAVFSPVTHLVWNTGDLCGRLLCQDPRYRVETPRALVTYACSRFAIVVALLLLARFGNPSDLLYLVLMLAYGITGGHLTSSAISYIPKCTETHLQPAAGGLICLIISIGLLAGALASFAVVAVL